MAQRHTDVFAVEQQSAHFCFVLFLSRMRSISSHINYELVTYFDVTILFYNTNIILSQQVTMLFLLLR